ncbi:MAG TPA: glycosyltransferase family 4 protein [Thermodesulfobacteriota bacterium]|nr:glycosyltransferase family 4 protein [Thermodesulfobacteriota bacterium]
MKVLIYTHEFSPFLGGLATTSYKIARGCRDAGLDVTVLAPQYPEGDKGFDNKFNFRVIRMVGLTRNHGVPSPVKEIAGFLSLSKVLSEVEPNAVFFVTREAHIAGGLLPSFSFKVIIRVAGYEAIRYLLGKKLGKRLLGLPMKRLYMRAHNIISPSHSTAELLERGGIPREKVKVIYNGVNPDMLSQNPNLGAIEKLRNKFNILDGEKVILTVARLVPGKGQESVIKALPKVTKECHKVKYLIVGEGRYEEGLKTLAYREGVNSRVIFAGPVPHSEVINFYDLCDLFIMPNRTIEGKENIEGLPNVVLEAASRGKPVITGIPGGAKEAIQHGRSGYIVDGGNIDEIATRILDLLKDDMKAREFGIQGRQRIQEMFTEERMIEEYLKVLGSNQ